MSDLCLFCDKPATILCDAMIARAIGDYAKYPGKPPHPVVTLEQTMLSTCDAPCCAEHARAVGHICGGKDGCETIDYCVKHAAGEKRTRLLQPAAVSVLRRKLHREWRLERVRLVPATQPEPPQ